jgi:dTDP-4-amino-4,6-dideoxygalactose transaminase
VNHGTSDSGYRIPLFDLQIGRDEELALRNTLRSRWISMGDNVRGFEEDFQAFLGVKHAVAVTNCTAALHLALHTAGVGVGDEVIVPSLTFVATVNAVRYTGATPVFADVTGPGDLSIDPRDIEAKVTPRTRAVIVMHYAGFACDMDAISQLAGRHGIVVIEDAAHAPGSEYRGRKLGTIGLSGCFSFFSNKNITTAEGGLLVTNDDDVARQARLLRSHGMTTVSYDRARGHATRYDVVELGYNYRMDDLRGALGRVQFKRLEKDIARRRVLRDRYVAQLNDLDGIVIPYRRHSDVSSNYIFPIVLADPERRDNLRERLRQAGVETSVHYPAVHKFSIYQDCATTLAQTEYIASAEITLPLYFRLKEEDVDFVCQTIRGAL